ncbi:hypothetical protein IMZ48_44715, partial [Candidatus Bathyarchaeota archaeon]|nr:hypothetical protein [Candidatus Bathyarchaeota archaeon]
MAAKHNIQNSFGPEVTAYEYMQDTAPQARNVDCPMYVVDDYRGQQPSHTSGSGTPDPPPEQMPEKNKPRRQILGLSPPVFWAVVVVSILLVLSTGVGVGVGVGVTQNKSSKSSTASPAAPDSGEPDAPEPEASDDPTSPSSSSPSTTSSAPVTSGTVGLSDNSCTSTKPTTYRASDGKGFTQF